MAWCIESLSISIPKMEKNVLETVQNTLNISVYFSWLNFVFKVSKVIRKKSNWNINIFFHWLHAVKIVSVKTFGVKAAHLLMREEKW